jgi:dienelactone hydrolase
MVTTRDVKYSADGTVMVGRLALPEGAAKRPAILIAHEGPGLDDEQRGRAQALAELGYVAFALDYHGGGRWLSDRDEMMTRLGVLGGAPERTRALARGGLDVLLSEPRADASNVAAIGYCFGGTVALELARSGAALKAVVGFHPGLSTVRPDDARNISGRVLVFVGTDDPFIPVEQRLAFEAEMREGGVDWEMILYGGAEHSFTHPRADPEVTGLPGIKYHPRAAERSWRTMLELFDEVFS